MMRLALTYATTLAVLALSACSSTGLSNALVTDEPAADYEVLLIGNSHSSDNDLPELVARLIEAGAPGSSARASAVSRVSMDVGFPGGAAGDLCCCTDSIIPGCDIFPSGGPLAPLR